MPGAPLMVRCIAYYGARIMNVPLPTRGAAVLVLALLQACASQLPQPEAPAEPKRAKRPAPKAGAKRGPARPMST